jgi:peptidoglycan/xylan/chitin deacetylase (PgdA/CDA1 family)
MTHPNLHVSSPRQVRLEISNCSTVLESLGGQRVQQFRAPFGHFRWDVRSAAKAVGIKHLVGWDVQPPADWTDVCRMTTLIERGVKAGSILMLHDGLSGWDDEWCAAVGTAASACLERILPALCSAYRIATTGERLAEGATDVARRNGGTYPLPLTDQGTPEANL